MDIEFDPLASLENQTTAIQLINENFEKVKEALALVLARVPVEGTNQMEQPLDMNSKEIINLAPPTSGASAVRWIDVTNGVRLTGVVLPSYLNNDGKFLALAGETLVWQAFDAQTNFLSKTANLSDVASVEETRTNLGLGTGALYDVGTTGNSIARLNSENVWGAKQEFNGLVQLDGGADFNGTADVTIDINPATLGVTSVGFRGVPVIDFNDTYTPTMSDSAKMLRHTSNTAHVYNLPPNGTVAFPVGTVLVVRNVGTGNVTITRGGGVTLRKDGSGTSQDIVLSQWGSVSLHQEAANIWVATGTNIA